MDGGNAIDSAIATAAALNVVEPYMSGLAGLGYIHIYSAEHGEHLILDYMGRSPRTTTRDAFIELDPGTQRGPRFPLVPGACAGWLAALERFGSLDAATVFAPAIELAEQGFAFTVNNHGFTQSVASVLKADPASAANYLREGAAPRPGDILVQPDLARTLRSIAAEGPDVFYRGMIAARMVERLGELGGLLTLEDLADYGPRWLKPIRCEYRGYRIYGPPPPCHGALSLALLKIMEGFDVATLGHNTPATLHRFVESCKLALADGLTYLGTENPPIEAMLSASYAADRRALIGEDARPSPGTRFSLEKPADAVSPGDPLRWAKTECTTHFDTIDADGNAVAVSQSIGSLFGCGLVIPGTGLAMNNGMWWFESRAREPKRIRTGQGTARADLASAGVGRPWAPDAHRHSGQLRHPPDDRTDDHERARSRHEHPGRDRGAPRERDTGRARGRRGVADPRIGPVGAWPKGTPDP